MRPILLLILVVYVPVRTTAAVYQVCNTVVNEDIALVHEGFARSSRTRSCVSGDHCASSCTHYGFPQNYWWIFSPERRASRYYGQDDRHFRGIARYRGVGPRYRVAMVTKGIWAFSLFTGLLYRDAHCNSPTAVLFDGIT